MTTKPRIYVDSSVFVSVLKNETATSAMCVSLLEAAERKDVQLVASRLVSVEVGAYRGDRPGEVAAGELIERYLDGVDTEWSELDIIVAREARRLSWAHNLRSADAIHLATAIRRRATHLMTLDEGFPLDQVVGGVRVSLPEVVWHPTLLDGENVA